MDADAGANADIACELINNTGHAFSISCDSQVIISLADALDYEEINHYHMTILVHDRGTPSRSSLAVLEVHVLDIPDSTPQFNASSYSIAIPEDAHLDTPLFTVMAMTADAPPLNVLRYLVVEGDVDLFHVDMASGALMLNKSLDYGRAPSHRIIVQAQSVANPRLYSEVPVVVSVLNINDHTPMFRRRFYNVSVRYSEPAGSHVTVLSADDADSGVFGEVTYSFHEDTDVIIMMMFQIDAETGNLSTRASLEEGGVSIYLFTVLASDGGIPPRQGNTTVQVEITSAPNTPPVFTSMRYSVEMEEGEGEGSSGLSFRDVVQVNATDSDANDDVTYFIRSGDARGVFSIAPGDGTIRARSGALDRERVPHYELVVVATDGRMETTARVCINVTDVNDHAPLFQRTQYVLYVSEGVAEGEEFAVVVATDRDEGNNGHVTYSLQGEESDTFSINNKSGGIVLRVGLDYETMPRSYYFDVVAMDMGESSRCSSVGMEIYVLDENDHTPQFLAPPTSANISENSPAGSLVLEVTANDADSADNARIRYWLTGSVHALQAFGIDETGGRIYTLRALDREAQDVYQLVVHAGEGVATPVSEDMISLTVYIDDVIDYAPLFSQKSYRAFVTNLTFSNSPLISVSASTLDVLDSSVEYSIVAGGRGNVSMDTVSIDMVAMGTASMDTVSMFRIDNSGRITSVEDIDPVIHGGVYVLEVRATHRHLQNSVLVSIRVMEEEEEGALYVLPLTIHFSVYFTLVPSTSDVGTVEAPGCRDAACTFSLSPSEPLIHNHFTLNSTTGVLSVHNNISTGLYVLNVSVSTTTRVGYGDVTVYIRLLTNSTLEAALVVELGGAPAHQTEYIVFLQLLSFVTEVLSASPEQVEIIGVQTPTDSAPRQTLEVALAVRSHDFVTYLTPSFVEGALYSHLSEFSLSAPSFEVLAGGCHSNVCPHLQSCSPLVNVHTSSSSPSSSLPYLTRFDTTDLIFHSLPFSLTHRCTCPEGYSTRDLCTSEINECSPNPCHFGGQCVDLVGGYTCRCPPGTIGKNCSIVCPSPSCDPCTPNPCLHGGVCRTLPTAPGEHTCSGCPWGEAHSGSNCELVATSLLHGGFLALPTLTSTARLALGLSFATIATSGLLLYDGRHDNARTDFIAVELVVGQVRVGVSLGGVATYLMSDSVSRLNDGRWHRVEVELGREVRGWKGEGLNI